MLGTGISLPQATLPRCIQETVSTMGDMALHACGGWDRIFSLAIHLPQRMGRKSGSLILPPSELLKEVDHMNILGADLK